MGLWQRIFGREDRPLVVEGTSVTIRREEIAARLRRPEAPNFGDEAQGPCDRCGAALAEVLITTGGALGDPDLWRDHPIAVDGWACAGCGVFRYPRRMAPERIQQILDEGAAHGQAGRVTEAEHCFARVVWDWPGYFPGHINYAEATRSRLHVARDLDAAQRRRLTERMREQYEAALASYAEHPSPAFVPPVARACLTLAEVALQAGARERAFRMADQCLKLPSVAAEDAERARAIQRWVDERHDLFEEAAKILKPYLRFREAEAAGKSVDTGEERKRVADALEKLEQHVAAAPGSWQGAWLLAKARTSISGAESAWADWERAAAAHPRQPEIARDYSLELLLVDRVAEARRVARAIHEAHPDDATLLCNLAVAEVLSGDLAEARRCCDASLALDPSDPVAATLKRKLAALKPDGPLPRTLRELERRS
jgi:tetratricopeptide (TPR) repeat protein